MVIEDDFATHPRTTKLVVDSGFILLLMEKRKYFYYKICFTFGFLKVIFYIFGWEVSMKMWLDNG